MESDGRPLSFAIISADIPDIAIPVSKKVTADMLGRFFLLVPPGKYDIKVQAKQPDGSYREVYVERSVFLKKGVLTKDIVVSE